LSALEALASGVPVVGSDAGGLPEVIRDGETGVLCPVGDIPGMAAAALAILQDRKRWAAMSKLAIEDSRTRFSRDAIVTQYESLYQRSLPIHQS
jgi:glycosyltransferase involved in cell wall biosynthesis